MRVGCVYGMHVEAATSDGHSIEDIGFHLQICDMVRTVWHVVCCCYDEAFAHTHTLHTATPSRSRRRVCYPQVNESDAAAKDAARILKKKLEARRPLSLVKTLTVGYCPACVAFPTVESVVLC